MFTKAAILFFKDLQLGCLSSIEALTSFMSGINRFHCLKKYFSITTTTVSMKKLCLFLYRMSKEKGEYSHHDITFQLMKPSFEALKVQGFTKDNDQRSTSSRDIFFYIFLYLWLPIAGVSNLQHKKNNLSSFTKQQKKKDRMSIK